MKLLTKELEKRFSAVGSQDGKGEAAVAVVKFFHPSGNWTWLATEFDPETREFFGYVKGFEGEWGYFSLDELETVKAGPFGLGVERDLYFREKTVREALAELGS